MNDVFGFDACPEDCYDDCSKCLLGYYGCLELAEESEVKLEEIETPVKFERLETPPPKPGVVHGYEWDHTHNVAKKFISKPKHTDKRRSPRIAPIMAEQFARKMEEQTQWSWLTSLYYEEIMNGFCQEFDRYNEDCQFLEEQSTLEEQEEEWADHESSFEDDDHSETYQEIMERPWA